MTVGRHPLPTVLKILRGTDRADRLPKNEAAPKSKIPKPPPHVQGIALVEWKRISRQLHKLKLLTAIDGTALAAYCIEYERWADANDKLRTHGTVGKTKNGQFIQSPFLSIANRAGCEMRKWLIEFGMTPSARSRVDVTPLSDGTSEF